MNVPADSSTESQQAMVAKRLATLRKGANQHAQICASSQGEAADLLKVSRRAVQHAAVVQAKAAPELVQAVDRGEVNEGQGDGKEFTAAMTGYRAGCRAQKNRARPEFSGRATANFSAEKSES